MLSFHAYTLRYILYWAFAGGVSSLPHVSLSATSPAVSASMGPNRSEKKHGFDKPLGGYFQPRSQSQRSDLRNHFVAAAGEFVGTFMFLFFAYLGHTMAVEQAPDTGPNGTNSNQTVIYIGLSYGLSLLVTAWTLYRISGGLFNPVRTRHPFIVTVARLAHDSAEGLL